MNTNAPRNMEKIISNVLQMIIAGAVVWMATEINKLDSSVSAIQEKARSYEDIRPSMNEMRLSEQEIKERLIRVEDNQHHPKSN